MNLAPIDVAILCIYAADWSCSRSGSLAKNEDVEKMPQHYFLVGKAGGTRVRYDSRLNVTQGKHHA
jgi:hypothetical protein